MRGTEKRFGLAAIGGVIALALSFGGSAAAADFIRGDANGDGKVTISDSYRMLRFLFMGYELDCRAAADADGSGTVDLSDPIFLLAVLFVDRTLEIPAPYPSPGPDTIEAPYVDCRSYGGRTVVADPTARIAIPDVVVPGGTDGKVDFEIDIASALPVAAVGGIVRLPAGLIAGLADPTVPYLGDAPPNKLSGYLEASMVFEDAFSFAYIAKLEQPVALPAGRAVVAVHACLKKGTKAGDYPIVIEEGELTDLDSGLPITTALSAGTLRVLADVTVDERCVQTPIDVGPVDPPPPPPEKITAYYQLEGGDAVRGGTIDVPFIVRANVPVTGYSFAIGYDPAALEETGFDFTWKNPDGCDYGFVILGDPLSGKTAAGTIVGVVIFDTSHLTPAPANVDNEYAVIHFRVLPGADFGGTEVRIVDEGVIPGSPPVADTITAYGKSYHPDLGSTFVYVNGRVNIIPDVVPFDRGDANTDGGIDLSDAIFTLTYLFLAGPAPRCPDVADADADGAVDVTDAVIILQHLYLAGPDLPPLDAAAAARCR